MLKEFQDPQEWTCISAPTVVGGSATRAQLET